MELLGGALLRRLRRNAGFEDPVRLTRRRERDGQQPRAIVFPSPGIMFKGALKIRFGVS